MHHTILKALFNKHLSRGKSVVENVFGILKKTFKELFLKTNLDILFVLDVVVYYYIFYNMIIDDKDFDLQTLMDQLNLDNKMGILKLLE
jgi:hypothetical protein